MDLKKDWLKISGVVLIGVSLMCMFIPVFQIPLVPYNQGWFLTLYSFGESFLSDVNFFQFAYYYLVTLAPVFNLVLAIWLLRRYTHRIPVIILSVLSIQGAFYWQFKYGGMGLLQLGYYIYLLATLGTVALNILKLRGQDSEEELMIS